MAMAQAQAQRESVPAVPVRRPTHLSPSTALLLQAHFRTAPDLDRAALLLPAVHRDYQHALHKPRALRALVADRLATAASDAGRFVDCLADLAPKADSSLGDKTASTSTSTSTSGAQAVHGISAVVEELVRVERCRGYVKRVLHVEMLVGDLEDAVASIAMGFAERRFKIGGSGAVRDSGESLLEALSRLQAVEGTVSSISQSWLEAGQLVRAVELRLDRAASTIRSATVDEFSSFLQSMGWPPPLTLGDSDSREDDSQRANPLLEASDSTLSRLKLYFRVLSVLQALQQKRAYERLTKDFSKRQDKTRDPAAFNADKSLTYEPLWAMEELVSPFAKQAMYHFKKWVQKPELVCQLAHTMCQGFVNIVDVLLQPVITDAGLTGYNAREEWVLCFSLMVQNFFKSAVFPGLAEDVEERSEASRLATSLWLHTIDQILAFDSKMGSLLVQNTGIVQFRSGSDSIIQHGIIEKTKKRLGVVHVFVERPHWLDVWAHIEDADAWEKLMVVLNTEEAWLVKGSNRTILEKGIPSGATAVLAAMWSVIDRCRTLPDVKLRLAFVRKAAVPIAEKYHDELLWRCHIGGFAGRATDVDVSKVALCINAARHCEYKLQEWSEDYFFLELRLEDVCQNIEYDVVFDLHGENSKDIGISGLEGTIFDHVISLYAGFSKDQISSLVSIITGKFERCCKSYNSSMASWLVDRFDSVNGVSERHPSQESSCALLDKSVTLVDKPSSVSGTFVEALFMLQQELKVLSDSLQDDDLTEFCWSLMMKLDDVFVSKVLPPSRRFSRTGMQQLMVDATGLFQVFQTYCVRPASIFKRLTGAIKEARRTVK